MSPALAFHPGELHAQRVAHTSAAAAELGAVLAPDLSPFPFAGALLSSMQHVWLTTPGEDGELWVTPLFGPPGFVNVPNPSTLEIQPALRADETAPLGLALQPADPVGLLAIDFATRRRFRINGVVASVAGDPYAIELDVREAFPNCPKYIFRREAHSLALRDDGRDTAELVTFEEDVRLSEADAAAVCRADTFMLGSAAHGRADVSHRGGRAGFVRVLDDRTLLWPDYRGNGMFQSFGNMHADADSVAVTFLDFSSGALLQLFGHADIVERDADPDGLLDAVERAAKRAVRFSVARVRRWASTVSSLQWADIEPSHYNPAVFSTVDTAQGSAEERVKHGTSPFPQPVTLVKIVRETHDIKTFRFLAEAPLRFLPGQYASFEFVAADVSQAEATERTWTLSEVSNSASGDVTLEVSVKRKKGGLISSFLHDSAEIGLRAHVTGVEGNMTPFKSAGQLDERSRRHGEKFCMISGGVGVTPSMAILRGLTGRKAQSDVAFLYQARGAEMPFRSEILRRARTSAGSVRILQAVSGDVAYATAADGLRTVRGRLDAARVKEFVPDIEERVVFLCGPPGFMTLMSKALHELGVDAGSVVTEKFDF